MYTEIKYSTKHKKFISGQRNVVVVKKGVIKIENREELEEANKKCNPLSFPEKLTL